MIPCYFQYRESLAMKYQAKSYCTRTLYLLFHKILSAELFLGPLDVSFLRFSNLFQQADDTLYSTYATRGQFQGSPLVELDLEKPKLV